MIPARGAILSLRETKMTWLQIALLAVVLVYLYGPTFGPLWTELSDPASSHGLIVMLIAAYLTWERRGQLLRCRARPTLWGLPLLTLGLATFLLGVAGQMSFVIVLSFGLVVAGLVIFLAGVEVGRILLLPLVLLAFLVPVPQELINKAVWPLQQFTAQFAVNAMQLIGAPVLREGNLIVLPTITLEVGAACAGLRYLTALGALTLLYATIAERSWWRQGILILSVLPIAIVVNALRVTVFVVAGLNGITALLSGPYHLLTGWALFVVTLMFLYAESAALSALAATRIEQ